MENKKSQQEQGNLITKTYHGLVEAITGIASSDRKDWALSIGYLCQRTRGVEFLSTLNDEWNKYRQKGKIKEEYQYTNQCKNCLQQLLDSLDQDSPDEILFSTLKQIFFVAATETNSDRDDLLPYQYMKICRTLSAGEIL